MDKYEREMADDMDDIEEMLNPDQMSEEELQGIVGKEIDDSIDYIDNWVSPSTRQRDKILPRRALRQ